MRARDLGLAVGTLSCGPRNSIADVPGLCVGHATIIRDDLRTGVTAIVPPGEDLFRDKLVAAADVLNGFGKSTGLVQLDELGTLETPILLTNTFGVGTCANVLIRRAIRANPELGRRMPTVNPVVLECNDGYLSDIQALAVTEADAAAALDAAAPDFASGAVGAGTGMSCFGLKGGIGTASRIMRLDGQDYMLGILVLANFGRAGDLRLPDGRRIDPGTKPRPDTGSIITIMATDLPLADRQLRRIARRAGVGLARLGSFWGNGSGDIALAFTTANRIPHAPKRDLIEQRILAEAKIDLPFRAAAEATEEAVLDALAAAEPMAGRNGHHRPALRDFL